MTRCVIACLLFASAAAAQEGSLDLLDGETLYEHGWLITAGYEFDYREGLRHGSGRRSDPLDRREHEHTASLAASFGLRYDLQLTLFLPWKKHTLLLDDPAGPDRFSSDGPGDAAFVAKWRFYRYDAPHIATNFAVLGGVKAPTGETDERDHGARLPPDLQPGSGSWDAELGVAVTHEPYRWRFNAAALWQRKGQGPHDFSFGDELFAEIAAGNRFWLEPYPGPFMRFDAFLRFRRESRDSDNGHRVRDSGGESLTFGATLAFRPRPTLDIQVTAEIPVYQSLNGTQLEEDFSLFLVFGVRF